MKLSEAGGHKKSSKKKHKRFYTALDMAEIKHQEAIKASEIKRGVREPKGNNSIIVCGCGREGCFLHLEHDSTLEPPTEKDVKSDKDEDARKMEALGFDSKKSFRKRK